jgi:SAM-dependent methyltransferase
MEQSSSESSNRPSLAFRPIHPFPARMAPKIVWHKLRRESADTKLVVLDPMAGSGTTLVTARLLGHEALGFDTDPLAVLIARAWASDVDSDQVTKRGEEVLTSARRRTGRLLLRSAYPPDASEETREFVRYWFNGSARRQLAALAAAITDQRNAAVRSLLWCAFSRLIIVKDSGASRAMDVSHSRPHRVFARAPVEPFEAFMRALKVVTSNAPFSGGAQLPSARMRRGDARQLPLDDESVDIVVTSPPYLNAIDYLRGHKFSLIWMGHDVETLREVRATNVGTEVGAPADEKSPVLVRALKRMQSDEVPAREVGMLRRYVHDMHRVMLEIARVLKPQGKATLVVGDSTVGGKFVANSRGLRVLGESAGLTVHSRRTRPLPPNRRYLPPPEARTSGKNLKQRMCEEVILTFARAA